MQTMRPTRSQAEVLWPVQILGCVPGTRPCRDLICSQPQYVSADIGKPRKLAECTESKCTSFVIAHINIRSMRNKLDELQLLLKKLSIDIMCVSETWLNDTSTDNTVNIAGYDIIRCDRISNTYGGVAILIRDNLVHKTRDYLKTEKSLEILWIEV